MIDVLIEETAYEALWHETGFDRIDILVSTCKPLRLKKYLLRYVSHFSLTALLASASSSYASNYVDFKRYKMEKNLREQNNLITSSSPATTLASTPSGGTIVSSVSPLSTYMACS